MMTAAEYIESLRHPNASDASWAGQPFRLLPWQRGIIDKLYPPGREREAETLLLLTGKKTGKTAFSAMMALACLKFEKQPVTAAVLAPTLMQADLLFRYIESAAQNSGIAVKRAGQSGAEYLKFENGNRVYLLSGAEKSKQGMQFNPLFIDESAELNFASSHFTDLNAFHSKPLTCFISNPPSGRQNFIEPWLRQRESRKFVKYVVRGKGADWRSEKTWERYNPSLEPKGHVKKSVYKKKVKEVSLRGPAAIMEFRRLWLSEFTYQSGASWLSPSLIRPVPRGFDEKKAYWHCGLDLSSARDFTSACLSASWEGKIILKVFNWLPRARAAEKADRHTKQARFFYDAGEVFLTKKDCVSPKDDVLKFLEGLELDIDREILIDRAKVWLYEDSESQFKPIPFSASLQNMTAPTLNFEKLALEKKVCTDSKMFRWALGNCLMTEDGHSPIRAPMKGRSLAAIDPVIAALLSTAKLEKSGSERFEPGLLKVF